MGFCTWRFLSLIVYIVFVSRVSLSLHYSQADMLCLHVFVYAMFTHAMHANVAYA